MKKYGTIFSSVILALVILLIPNNEVKAINLNGIEIEPPVDINTNAFIIATNTYYKENSNKLYEYVAISYESFDYVGFYYDARYNDLYIRPSDNSSWPKSSHWVYDGENWILKEVSFGLWTMPLNQIFYSNVDIINYATQEVVYESDLKKISYDNNLQLNPNNYNFFYLKFNVIGDNAIFFKHILNSEQDIFYSIYKNADLIYTPIVFNNKDLYIQDYFYNTLDTDVYTIIIPFYKYDFLEDDIFDFYFTIPGLIEYGTNEFKYNFKDNEWVSSDTDRSDVTDLLKPSENKPSEIVSSGTSHNTLSNDSLNEFMWPYSLFARNGNNIKNVSLTGSFSSTSSFSVNDFNSNLIINYGEENYKININNCISIGNCNLTKFEQDMIKNILFDRNVENSNYYLDFSIVPLKDMTLTASDQFNFGISINFNSSVELTINSMLLAINDLSNSYYNVYFKLYDSSGQVHTIYKTSLDSEYIGVNQFQLDSRTADIYRVDLMFIYNHTLSAISTNNRYSLKFSEFNIFANTEMIHIYTNNTEATYQTCSWYDLFCHGQNLFTWLTYEAPGSSDFWNIFLYIVNIFDMLWVIVTYIFMPFDIIPPIFGIPMSTILPFILIVLVLIKKLWFGGGD